MQLIGLCVLHGSFVVILPLQWDMNDVFLSEGSPIPASLQGGGLAWLLANRGWQMKASAFRDLHLAL